MSLAPPGNDNAGPPSGSSFLPLMFILFVALCVAGVLMIFSPGTLIVLVVLVAMIVSQYFLWGRWLRNTILAEEAAEEELKDKRGDK
jgi:hypothetical protein